MPVSVRTTAEIAETLYRGDGRGYNHAVPVTRPLGLLAADLPIPPYVLGTWLCMSCWEDRGTPSPILRRLGVLNNKHIPTQYLRASRAAAASASGGSAGH